MDIQHLGQNTRYRYEVGIYKMTTRGEDLWDIVSADGYRDAIAKAKKLSLNDGITHTEVVKNIDYYYPDRPEDILDWQVKKRWIYEKGKQIRTLNW